MEIQVVCTVCGKPVPFGTTNNEELTLVAISPCPHCMGIEEEKRAKLDYALKDILLEVGHTSGIDVFLKWLVNTYGKLIISTPWKKL